MFEKLLSLAPYNPSMVHHLAFYGRRMREEASIRRVGTVFLALAFVVQSIAVFNPPVSAENCPDSNNNILECGFNSPEQARKFCMQDKQGYKKFLHYYGISCNAFNGVKPMEIQTNGQNYFSSGRNLSPTEDHPRDIPGTGEIFWRDLDVWARGAHKCADDPSKYNCWTVLPIKDQDGETWYVMYDCGNLVSDRGVPPGNKLRAPAYEDTVEIIDTPVETNSNLTYVPVQGDQGVPGPTGDRSPYIPEGTTTVPVVVEAQQVTPCKFNPSISSSSNDCPYECPTNAAIPADSEQCFYPCPYNGSISDTNPLCKPCDKSADFDDAAACVSVRKSASNITQNIADANNTTAKAGDIITYTLYAQNKSEATVFDFTFQENLSDVLDYADVVDAHGGTLAVDQVMAWPVRDLDASESASVQVTVKVKDPIPQTPAAANNPGRFDMIMTNVYGDAINIKLPAAPAKSIETAAAKLPNTGPGTTLIIAASIVILAGYFYSRASLLSRESNIAVKDQG